MAVFSTRPALYKVGLIGLFVFTALFIIGYSSPFWVVSDRTNERLGLWMTCSDSLGCYSLGMNGLAVYFHIVRLLETIGLIFLGVACVHGMSTNFCRTVPRPFSRALETLSGVGGSLGLTGAIVFFAKYVGIGILEIKYGWAIYLSTVGSAAAVVCSILISISNKNPALSGAPPHQQQMQNIAVVGGGPVAGGPVIVQHSASSQSTSAYPSAPPPNYYYGPSTSAQQQQPQAGYPYPAQQQQSYPTK